MPSISLTLSAKKFLVLLSIVTVTMHSAASSESWSAHLSLTMAFELLAGAR
jgi:hypothetical protein